MSLNFGQIPPLTTELAALERLKNRCHHVISVDIDPIFFKLAGNKDMHNIMNEFEFRPDRTTDYGVSCPWASKKYPYRPYNGENGVSTFLAHLRLTRWAYSIPMVRRPSVRRRPSSVVVRRRPHFQTWISLKSVGQSWSNYMCSITGMGERLHQVLGQIGLKLWFPWQQKAPIDL